MTGGGTLPLTEPGVYRMSLASYLAVDAVNWHTIEPMRRSPKHCRFEQAVPSDATLAMKLGDALHAATFEPARFAREYVAEPQFEGHPNSNLHKQQKAAWREAHGRQVPITQKEWARIEGMSRAVREYPPAAALLRGRGRNEMTVVWRDAATGVMCKGKVDRLCEVDSTVLSPTARVGARTLCLVDLKSTAFVGIEKFDREVDRLGYHGQLAFYHDGLQATEPAPLAVLILAVENAPPYDVALRSVDLDTLEEGQRLYRRLLRQYAACVQANRWPGVAPEYPVPIVLPKWGREPQEEID